MDLQLCVFTDIDLDTEQVRLTVTGALTAANHQLLCQVVHRAQVLTASTEVVVDLTGTSSWEASAVELVFWEIDHHDPDGSLHPVGFVLPAPPGPHTEIGAAPAPRIVWIGAGRRADGDES